MQAEIEEKDQAKRINLIWLTVEEQLLFIKRIHKGSVGHVQEKKLFQALRLRFWWKEMRRDIRQILEECEVYGKVARPK